jgi:hypothetical protein
MTECIVVGGLLLCVVGVLVGMVSLIYFIRHNDPQRDHTLIEILSMSIGLTVGFASAMIMLDKYIFPLLPCIQVV